ncbi:MAG TPA: GNAT family N-acetyltransferase [Gammaproteobacteria bacterium]
MTTDSTITIRQITSGELEDAIPELARLRIQVFREFPYLYDGTWEYEEKYLRTYSESGAAIAILALDGARIVGASTGVPMSHETGEFKRPFIEGGYDPARIFYCGESVLLPEYRGKGIYKEFIRGRENYARTRDGSPGPFDYCCFCAVERDENHPLRPDDFQPLDAVWRHFGYVKRPDLLTEFRWKDIDQPHETAKPMTFWVKPLLSGC